ncbi:hypothetical protein PENSPDRAFT_656380 [Peniophora sp. CONT]|nr:hypothetical protein PENSPDRAFT_656380 [Peniophora sp. CONT]
MTILSVFERTIFYFRYLVRIPGAQSASTNPHRTAAPIEAYPSTAALLPRNFSWHRHKYSDQIMGNIWGQDVATAKGSANNPNLDNEGWPTTSALCALRLRPAVSCHGAGFLTEIALPRHGPPSYRPHGSPSCYMRSTYAASAREGTKAYVVP